MTDQEAQTQGPILLCIYQIFKSWDFYYLAFIKNQNSHDKDTGEKKKKRKIICKISILNCKPYSLREWNCKQKLVF